MRRPPRLAVVAAVLAAAGLLAGCTGAENPTRTPSSSASGQSGPSAGESEPASELPADGDPATGPAQQPAPTQAATDPTQEHLTLPLPAAASADGEIVPGFPTGIVPVPPAATIVATSVTGQGDRLQFALEATSPTPPDDVIRFYRTSLTATGFVEETTPAPAGGVAASFLRQDDGVAVSVRTALGGGSQISVAGVLRATG